MDGRKGFGFMFLPEFMWKLPPKYIPLHAFIEDQKRRTRAPHWMLTRIALQVHDAIISCVTPETVYDVAECLRANMERELSYDGTPMTIPIELKLGTSWKMSREWKQFPTREELEIHHSKWWHSASAQ